MEATGGGAMLRRVPFGLRQAAGDVGLWSAKARPMRVKIGNGFEDQGHLRYYESTTVRCGLKKEEEKRRKALVKGLEKDLSALYSMDFGVEKGEGMVGEVKGQIISEAAEVLLAQLTKLRAEAKEMKKRRKQEKAAMKAAKMKGLADDSSSSSSSESSDSECETVVKMSSLTTAPDPITTSALQTEDVIEEAKNNLTLNLEPEFCSSTNSCCKIISAEVAVKPMDNTKIEVCMGGKCKKSGAMELMAEFERKVGVEGAVVGCKCMGKCREGPNVRVSNQSAEDGLARVSYGPLCIGVGLEDVGSIVANFFGEREDVGFLAA